jgi:quercetin dioxygenase-like cupin family protein
MIAADLNDAELRPAWCEHDPALHWHMQLPFQGDGLASFTPIYFTLEPGHMLPWHTDSEEELILVLAGTVEITVGYEGCRLQAEMLASVPAMEPHRLCNVGAEVARLVGIFAGTRIVSTFEYVVMPEGDRVFSLLANQRG